MRVLIISYYYPPTNCIASTRIGKWAKYLQENGVEPWVLTLEAGLFPSAGELPIEIPEEHIIRADLGPFISYFLRRRSTGSVSESSDILHCDKESINIETSIIATKVTLSRKIWEKISVQFSDLRFPDRALPWVYPALKAGNHLLKSTSFDAVLSSYGPPSSHLVASILVRRYKLPWVADFRDLWSQNYVHTRSGIPQILEAFFEKIVISKADELITVSEPLAEKLKLLHKKTVRVIPNGFDEEDFTDKSNINISTCSGLRIVYTGMIYKGKQDPSALFEAISLLGKRNKIKSCNIEIHFVGTDPGEVNEKAQYYGCKSMVYCYPRCTYSEALKWQINADILLLLDWNDPSAKGVYTGKVFEYIGSKRPILAIGHPGSVNETLLNETKSGILHNNPEVIADWIDNIWLKKKLHGSTCLPERSELISPYSRRYQASMVASVLKEVNKN